MVVGLPGTGIAGLFYLCLAVWMPINEVYMLARGRSSLRRWRFIAFNWLIVSGMLASLWAAMFLMKSAVNLIGIDHSHGILEKSGLIRGLAGETNAFFASAGWASALSLVVLILAVQVLKLTVGRAARPRSG